MSAELFPTFLKLRGRKVVVVGGGSVAAAKLPALVSAGARVTVVAPGISPALERAAGNSVAQVFRPASPGKPEGVRHASRPVHQPSGVRLVRRRFRASDLDGAWFVVAAAPPSVNRRVAAAARRRRLFVNVVDDPRHATAYAGAVVRKGGVMFVISTGGHAPGLAALLRQALDAVLPEDLDAWLHEAGRARRGWIDRGIPMAARRPLLLDVLNGLYREREARSG